MSLQIPAPNLQDRHINYVQLMWRNHPSFRAYRVRLANTLNDAYGPTNGVGGNGTEFVFDVEQGTSYFSISPLRKGLHVVDATHRTQTKAIYDPADFYNPPTTTVVPSDGEIGFIRTQVKTAFAGFPGATTNLNQSAIKILPPPYFMSNTVWPSMTLNGTAPALAVAVGDLAPDDSMQILVPPFAQNIILRNFGVGDLLYSTGPGLPLVSIPAGEEVNHMGGTVLSLCSVGNPTFRLIFEFKVIGEI